MAGRFHKRAVVRLERFRLGLFCLHRVFFRRSGLRRRFLRRCLRGAESREDPLLDGVHVRFGLLLGRLVADDLLRRQVGRALDERKLRLRKLARFLQKVCRGSLGRVQLALLQFDLSLQRADLGAGLVLGAGKHGFLFLFRLFDHGVRHALGGQESGAHGILRRAVFLHLVDQHLELGLQGGVFFIKRGIVVGHFIEELVDHRHIVATECRLAECAAGNLLRCQH